MLPFEVMERKLQSALSLPRYIHTMGVVKTAKKLAGRWQADEKKAMTAALLHDCAKDYPEQMKRRFCKEFHVPIDPVMDQAIDLCHGPLGAEVARREYGVTDEEVLNAIRYHTTGRPEMTKLEQIIFIADYIEPQRDKAPRLDVIRRLAFEDLEECMYQILKDSMSYLSANPEDLDRTTETAYQYYKKLHDSRKSEVKE